jgi:phosphatidate cytidylyltransferase
MMLSSSRLLTGASAFAAFIFFGLMAPASVAYSFFLAVLFLAGLEWGNLSGLKSVYGRLAFALMAGILSTILLYLITSHSFVVLSLVTDIMLVLWIAAFCWILFYQVNDTKIIISSIVLTVVGTFVLVSLAVSVALIRSSSLYFLFSLVLVVSCVDIFAFVGGRSFGRHKLISNVSPGKTWEGLGFGIMGAFCIGNLLYFTNSNLDLYLWNGIMAITIFAAVVGDLFESMIKRFSKVKNSGAALPGHGGVLDRLDSLCAAAPVYLWALLQAGYIP